MTDKNNALILSPQSDDEPFGPSSGEVVPMDNLPAVKQEQVRQLVATIDLDDTNSIIAFGVEAQSELTASADKMLQQARNKDVGPVGDVLGSLMLQVRGLDIDDLEAQKASWFKRNVLRRVSPIAKFVQRYEGVQNQIDGLVSVLGKHRGQLIQDVGMLDSLYDATVGYFQQLELFILAGKAKLQELDTDVLPALRSRADETGEMIDAQTLRDMVARRDDLERRVHDLQLARQVTIQSMPQIRMIQDVDKSLVNKIQSSVLTTIPVWKSQIAMAITLWNQQAALKTQRAVTDTTNELLRKNAELLRMGSAEARQEIERGIFDIETVKAVNEELIATIQESIEITQEGRQRRRQAETEMRQLEGDLKQALISADNARKLIGS